ncbi:hypothetical protein AM571_PA00109 (plasmid) [Rhizobium etli 8C-3]|uniref:Uncharacterized protein n=1 Tax=Rhizobium etli 8C-3 TaxID=538025 RepID=A0A1L5PA22_RHIET|nr:hypothetical protein AM571_PA00109 [Rhizobium etli 8C-3]
MTKSGHTRMLGSGWLLSATTILAILLIQIGGVGYIACNHGAEPPKSGPKEPGDDVRCRPVATIVG